MTKQLHLIIQIFILTVSPLVSSLVSVNDHRGTPSKRDANGNLYNPAIELTNDNGQKILLVGMNHVAYPGFYDSVNNYINTWITTENQTTEVIHEFFTCTGSVLDNGDYKVKAKDIDKLAAAKLDFEPAHFLRADETQIEPALKAFAMKKSPCRLDVDGKTMRPTYYVERNQKWCESAKTHGGACQWLSFNVPDSKLVKNVEGDLNLDIMPAGLQFEAALQFKDYPEKEVDPKKPVVQQLFRDRMFVGLPFRNRLLTMRVMDSLAKGTQRIVLPWGNLHMAALLQLLKENGFKQTKTTDILVFRHDQFGKWPLVDNIFNDKAHPMSDHYAFQDL